MLFVSNGIDRTSIEIITNSGKKSIVMMKLADEQVKFIEGILEPLMDKIDNMKIEQATMLVAHELIKNGIQIQGGML